jgi:HK97 family phage major capsid protein
MAADDAAGETVAVYGSIAEGYRIVDRVGLTVELVAHLFGANRRPTGQRGLYAYARTGAAVVIPNAIRTLIVAT